jgi:CheY-like chemotaxis protein
VRSRGSESSRVLVVWSLPSRLISKIGPVPPQVQLDVMSTAWATLRRLRGQPCDLLLLHLDLPDSTGPALAARVRILHSELPIVLTTDRDEMPELGMNLAALRLMGPLAIPVSWPVLLERVAGRAARPSSVEAKLAVAGRVAEQPAV